MRSLQSYADTVSPRKRPRNSCSNCVFLAPQTSPESRIVWSCSKSLNWSINCSQRRAPNSRPRTDRPELIGESHLWGTLPCEPGLFAECHMRNREPFRTSPHNNNELNFRLILDSRFGQRKD